MHVPGMSGTLCMVENVEIHDHGLTELTTELAQAFPLSFSQSLRPSIFRVM